MLKGAITNLISISKLWQPNLLGSVRLSLRHASSLMHSETIYALSSGFGKCGVSMIRVSGSSTSDALSKMTRLKRFPTPRQTFVAPIFHPVKKIMLDRAMLIYFAAPNSFTGEDVCEFHVHGGPAVVASVLDALSSIECIRPAEAGEFTKRAFLNNKLDLTEVEGLGDLIHAETEAQRRQALSQMEGSLSTIYKRWSKDLTKSLAHVEAFIDFSEDESLDDDLLPDIVAQTNRIDKQISHHLNDRRRGERLRNGLRVVIVGEPNAGKSSLLNTIVRRPAAIVSPIAGTTRDVIDSLIDIGGYPVILSDTAGLRESDDSIENEGVSRALKKLTEADIVVLILDVKFYQKLSESGRKMNLENLKEAYCKHLKIDEVLKSNSDCNVLVVVNKIDLLTSNVSYKLCEEVSFLSCKTEEGISSLVGTLSDQVKLLCDNIGESPSLTQQRHRHHLVKCQAFLKEALCHFKTDPVIGAEFLRFSLNELGKLSGKVSSEQILDVVFRDFCIGK